MGEIEERIARIEKKQSEILGFLSKICRTITLESEEKTRRELWQLKEEIDKALSK
ncbi:hypothetical protein KJA14_02695 [Patescibacteria group bacterium]|nr:hypothetical protein [Patescibacteria group bacterium]